MKLLAHLTTAEDVAASPHLAEQGPLLIRVSGFLLQEVYGQPFTRADGAVITLDAIYLWLNDEGQIEAEPVFTQRSPVTP